MAAHAATGAVTGGAECEIHAFLCSRQNIGRGAHGAADENRLTDLSEQFGNCWVPGPKGARGALAVNEELHLFSVHRVLFNFAGVVRYVVKQRQHGMWKNFTESFPHKV